MYFLEDYISAATEVSSINIRKKFAMFSPGIEPGTFCVLDRCDNRYTTKTCWGEKGELLLVSQSVRPSVTLTFFQLTGQYSQTDRQSVSVTTVATLQLSSSLDLE